MKYYVIAYLGMIVSILILMLKAKRTHKKDFKKIIWLQDNILSIILSVTAVTMLMLGMNGIIVSIGTLSKFPPEIVAMIIGMGHMLIIKVLMDIAFPKKLRK